MTVLTCDHCKEEFSLNLEVEKLRTVTGIEKYYFTCTHCKQKYTAYYLDNDCIQWQKEIRLLKVQISKNKFNTQKYMKQIRKLNKRLETRMQELKTKLDG